MFVDLPCDEPNAVRRLMDVHLATSERKDADEPRAADRILRSIVYLPHTVQQQASRLIASPRTFNLVVSNIPGPREPLYMCGCELERAYPVVPLADNHALSIGITTVRDRRLLRPLQRPRSRCRTPTRWPGRSIARSTSCWPAASSRARTRRRHSLPLTPLGPGAARLVSMRSDAFRAAAEAKDFSAAEDLFAEDVVFRSPVVFKPYEGRDALRCCSARSSQVFEDFRYVEQVETGDAAVLMFEARVGDRELQGVDILRFDDEGRIREMIVMVRPMSGMHALAEAMQASSSAGLARLRRPRRTTTRGARQVEIKKVGVLGCGLMGHGIAQICAQAGWDVVVREVDQEQARQGHRQDREAARAGRSRRARSSRRTPTPSAGGSRAPSTTPTSPTATW